MKKVYLLVIFIICFSAFEACGGKESTKPAGGEVQGNSALMEEEDETDSLKDYSDGYSASNEAADTSVSDTSRNNYMDAKYEELVMFPSQAQIERTELVDEQGIRITATGIEYGSYSVKVKLEIENNTDVDFSVTAGTVGYCCNIVNGYMIEDGYMSTSVAAGKKANDDVEFSNDMLLMHGITEIAEIDLGFRVVDANYKELLISGPRKIKTSLTSANAGGTYQDAIRNSYVWEKLGFGLESFANDILYNENGLSLVSEAVAVRRDGEKMLLLEVVNESGKEMYVQIQDLFVNGVLVNAGTWSSSIVADGARIVASIILDNVVDGEIREVLGITDFGSVELSILAVDNDYNELAPEKKVAVTCGSGSTVGEVGDEIYNQNGVRILSAGIVTDASSYSADVHLVLVVQNNANDVIEADLIEADLEYESLSVNDVMADSSCHNRKLRPGEAGVLDIEIDQDIFENGTVPSIDDIKKIEFKLELEKGRHDKLDNPLLVVEF